MSEIIVLVLGLGVFAASTVLQDNVLLSAGDDKNLNLICGDVCSPNNNCPEDCGFCNRRVSPP